jgi:hypothetical protein
MRGGGGAKLRYSAIYSGTRHWMDVGGQSRSQFTPQEMGFTHVCFVGDCDDPRFWEKCFGSARVESNFVGRLSCSQHGGVDSNAVKWKAVNWLTLLKEHLPMTDFFFFQNGNGLRVPETGCSVLDQVVFNCSRKAQLYRVKWFVSSSVSFGYVSNFSRNNDFKQRFRFQYWIGL